MTRCGSTTPRAPGAGFSAQPPGAQAPVPARRGDAIDLWLTVFARFLRMPGEQGRAIRDELDAHVRERVRDLMLEGLSEDEGTRRAIDELGEAADLAAHFRAAHRSPWRLTMSIAAIGVAASAAVLSIVALSQTGQPPAATVMPTGAGASPAVAGGPAGEGVPVLREVPIVGTFFTQRDVSPVIATTRQPEQPGPRINLPAGEHQLRKVLETIAAAAGRRLVLSLPQGIDLTNPLSIELVDTDVPGALRRINRVLDRNGVDRLDMRLRGDVMEIATVADFDKDETTLVAYDLSAAFQQGASTEGLAQTLTGFIEPESWRENGGATAKLMIVGKRLFVEAPPRHQEGVLWILNQFGGRPRVKAEQSAEPQREIVEGTLRFDQPLSDEETAVLRERRAQIIADVRAPRGARQAGQPTLFQDRPTHPVPPSEQPAQGSR